MISPWSLLWFLNDHYRYFIMNTIMVLPWSLLRFCHDHTMILPRPLPWFQYDHCHDITMINMISTEFGHSLKIFNVQFEFLVILKFILYKMSLRNLITSPPPPKKKNNKKLKRHKQFITNHYILTWCHQSYLKNWFLNDYKLTLKCTEINSHLHI